MLPLLTEWEAGWTPEPSGRFGAEKNPLPLPGIEPIIIQPIA